MRRRSNVSFRSHIGRDVADYGETSSRRRDCCVNETDLIENVLDLVETSSQRLNWYVNKTELLKFLCDVSLVSKQNRLT